MVINKCKKPRCQFKSGEETENSASQTQYLGHAFIDVIFRFCPHSLCPCGPLSGHASCPCPEANTTPYKRPVLTRQPADADSLPSFPLM